MTREPGLKSFADRKSQSAGLRTFELCFFVLSSEYSILVPNQGVESRRWRCLCSLSTIINGHAEVEELDGGQQVYITIPAGNWDQLVSVVPNLP